METKNIILLALAGGAAYWFLSKKDEDEDELDELDEEMVADFPQQDFQPVRLRAHSLPAGFHRPAPRMGPRPVVQQGPVTPYVHPNVVRAIKTALNQQVRYAPADLQLPRMIQALPVRTHVGGGWKGDPHAAGIIPSTKPGYFKIYLYSAKGDKIQAAVTVSTSTRPGRRPSPTVDAVAVVKKESGWKSSWWTAPRRPQPPTPIQSQAEPLGPAPVVSPEAQIKLAMVHLVEGLSKKAPSAEDVAWIKGFIPNWEKTVGPFATWYNAQPESKTTWAPLTAFFEQQGLLGAVDYGMPADFGYLGSYL